MVTDYRRRVLNALVAALSDQTTGFNAALAGIATTYDIAAYEIGWSLPSDNCVYGQFDEVGARVAQLRNFPGAIIYTTTALKENRVKFTTFSGLVVAVIDLIIRLRSLDDANQFVNQPDFGGDFEKHPDAAEDAMLSALTAGRTTMSASSVNWTEYKTSRSPVVETGDGHIQRLTFTLGFEVHI